jgi:hypothetical protein
VHDAAIHTHKAVTQAVESILTYIRQSKGKKALTRDGRVAERLVSRYFDNYTPNLSTNGVNGLLATSDDESLK